MALLQELFNENNNLTDKLNNNKDMITFYKNQIEQQDIKSLNISINNKDASYNAHIKSLDDKYKKELLDVKDLYKNTLESKTNEYQNHLTKLTIEFKDKLDLELQKKQLEIDKLNTELILAKTHKTKALSSKTK